MSISGEKCDPKVFDWFMDQMTMLLAYGADAENVVVHAPVVVDMLFPSNEHPALSELERGKKVEQLLEQLLSAPDMNEYEPFGAVLKLLYGIASEDVRGATLSVRIARASQARGVTPPWFKRKHQRYYISVLAEELAVWHAAYRSSL